MRITVQQRLAIVAAVREIFGLDATVRLFGSRADDTARGGDIDLYIETPCLEANKADKASKLVARIGYKLGDLLPIDVVVQDQATPLQRIHLEGKQGILL
ncbi:MAG: nucleotidyltransferase domain-containing protein [Gallionella sp.]|nr:nucleotidyltransferase domain-containing protein [Gallionella sp.]MDD4958183.1 nucleotidyltransferase domain-containing protein [Gallionella sp.]